MTTWRAATPSARPAAAATTTLTPLRRPADHRRLGLPMDRAAQLRARLLDRPGRRPAAAPHRRHRPDRCRAAPCAADQAARQPGRAATAPSATAPTRPPGRLRPPRLPVRTTRTAPSPSRRGRGCIPSSTATPATAAEDRGRSCAAPSCASRSSASPPRRAHRRCCGCGGPAPAPLTWTWPGARTCAGSTWSTPSASASRPSAGPPHGRATPPTPTAGPGWWWPATPHCAWPASSPSTSACPGSGRDHPGGCRLPGAPRGSAPAVRAGVASRRAEPRRALPRPTQRPLLRTCQALPGDQQAHHQANEAGSHDQQHHPTGQPPLSAHRPCRRPAQHASRLNHTLS